jgi:nucleotide-binding universal stress UspA family protein
MNGLVPLRTILVATDFSPDAEAAIEWARQLASEHGARLVLVHAVVVGTPAAPEWVPLTDEFYADAYAKAKEQLDAVAATLRGSGLEVESELTVEPVVANVLAVAAAHEADLLVAGTRGLTAWKRVVFGSASARLVREARCPVLTTHAEDPGRHRPARTILVPTDFSEDAFRAAEAAARILGKGGPDRRLVLLHVYRYPVFFAAAPQPVLASSMEAVVDAAQQEMARLAERFAAGGLHVDTRIVEGEPAKTILRHAVELGADVIAMGTHGRSGIDRLLLGSTAERVVSAAPCPVLTVRTTS